MTKHSQILTLLEKLAGQEAPFGGRVPDEVGCAFAKGDGDLGYSQLNELLLLFGFDRVNQPFFRFLLDRTTEYEPGDAFSTFEQLEEGVNEFRKIAILLYGNVKFAFKNLSRDVELLESALAELEPLSQEEFSSRHAPILPVSPISSEDAYLTGYLIERELQERRKDPNDHEAEALEARRVEIVERAKKNHRAYLASDHLDVYVATSMRDRHEFLSVSHLTTEIFNHDLLRPLKLRWFDPTQACCENRIDKGLSEALMLRRAACTLYLAQESDTLGKDSELASTLAQGKPVVAYLPTVDERYVDDHMKTVAAARPGEDPSSPSLLLDQLRRFDPAAAWESPDVRAWCETPSSADVTALRGRLQSRMKSHYDSRASTLCESHPLGIQVNLETGVANGVLVVRSVDECVRLIERIVTRNLELMIQETGSYTAIRERISDCIFRVMTADAMLTNTFWNFYLNPAE